MPEIPDVDVYVERIEALCAGHRLDGLRILSPTLLRSVDPPPGAAVGTTLLGARRLGKRVVFAFEEELFLVFHLMVSGRLRWKKAGAKPSRKMGLAALDFEDGSLVLSEASTQKRATLHVVRGEAALAEHDPGGLEVQQASASGFRERLRAENRTLKRALTDPRILSGIGNAYSDEILHRARLSPVQLTQKLDDAAIEGLRIACLGVLEEWTARLRAQVGEGFPDKVTAFHPEMAVHGRYGEACPDCGAPVQRIVYAANETNYCARCQTGGKLLADRALSPLLKRDWPRTLEALEARKRGA